MLSPLLPEEKLKTGTLSRFQYLNFYSSYLP